jgi:hypothetical protein
MSTGGNEYIRDLTRTSMHQPQGTYARYYHVTRHMKAREDAVEESGEKTNEKV